MSIAWRRVGRDYFGHDLCIAPSTARGAPWVLYARGFVVWNCDTLKEAKRRAEDHLHHAQLFGARPVKVAP